MICLHFDITCRNSIELRWHFQCIKAKAGYMEVVDITQLYKKRIMYSLLLSRLRLTSRLYHDYILKFDFVSSHELSVNVNNSARTFRAVYDTLCFYKYIRNWRVPKMVHLIFHTYVMIQYSVKSLVVDG